MFLIVGLGNPGDKYEHTRHNAGFDTIDCLADQYGISIREKKHKALLGQGMIEGNKVILAKPQTFMNLSGEAVAEILNYYKMDPETELIVIFDDISLDAGNIRIRKKGSAGGHNGIKNIIARTGTQNFMRIKVGVGMKPTGGDLVAHVMGRLPKDEAEYFDLAKKNTCEAIAMILRGEIDRAMNAYNKKVREKEEA
ncbi:MAG: aminoacyl-tRNA hydrolase [Agathobacter sp.]|uniref:aminoacyl-tRNA hydrolase n=1 Tax=Agathobacter sp. TaxID=2021311 RepID=UPI002580455B|nr:aminoacyl-tRNA hydrolase [Agathobacter sp.]MBQ1681826.1 aminoacyl-tRNA hydrolase [Agathobacter sp.]